MTRRMFLLSSCGFALAQVSPALKTGFHHLYHLRFTEARSEFTNWQVANPSDPMGFIAEAASHLFEEFETQGVLTTEFFLDDDRLLGGIAGKANEKRTRAFEATNQRGRSLAETHWKRDSKDSNALLSLTLAAGMRADYLSLIEKSQIASLREIRTAEAHGRQLLKIAPTMADGYVALGAANYILACLPAYKRAVLWFGGMQGDKKRGLDQLSQAAHHGTYLAPYAKILLALALLREKRGEEAFRWASNLVTEFPASPLFRRERDKIQRLSGITA